MDCGRWNVWTYNSYCKLCGGTKLKEVPGYIPKEQIALWLNIAQQKIKVGK